MDTHWPLYRDVLPRLQGTKTRGCYFCLPSALTLPCNHSMWSVLSGFSLRSETKVPGPQAFTAVTTLQMSALACPLSLLLPPKKPQIHLSLYLFPCPPSEHSVSHPEKLIMCVCAHVHVCVCICVCVHMYVCARKATFFPVSIPPPLPKGEEKRWREGRRDLVPFCTQQNHCMPLDVGDAIKCRNVQRSMLLHFSSPNNQPHHHHSSLQWEQSFQRALFLLWSKSLIISSHVYRSDCILPCSIFVFLPPFTHLICYFFPFCPLYTSSSLFEFSTLCSSVPVLLVSFAQQLCCLNHVFSFISHFTSHPEVHP